MLSADQPWMTPIGVNPRADACADLEELRGILKRDFVATPHIFGHVAESAGDTHVIEIEDEMIRRTAVSEAAVRIKFRGIVGTDRAAPEDFGT